MSKFTFHYGGTAFHRAFLTYHKNVEAHTKGELRDPERRGFCAQRLPFVEIHTSRKCSLESTWVGTMWPQTLSTGRPYQSKSLPHPLRYSVTDGYLWKLGKTWYSQAFVLSSCESWTWNKVYQAINFFLYFTLCTRVVTFSTFGLYIVGTIKLFDFVSVNTLNLVYFNFRNNS